MRCLLLSALFLSTPGDLTLDDSTYERWRDHIVPSAEELAFEKIAWRTQLWAAVMEAQEVDRPILLWAMNGHPMGCT